MKKDYYDLSYLMLVCLTSFSVFISGCATEGKSVGLGGLLGAGTGAAIGGIVDPGKNGEYRTRNIIVGGALGGMAGMAAGAVLYDSTEKKKKEAFDRGRTVGLAKAPQPGQMPELKEAKTEAQWVEGRVVGNRYIEGHFEYLIVEPARWDGGN